MSSVIEKTWLDAARAYPTVNFCQASKGMIEAYLTDNLLSLTAPNISKAIQALRSQLAKAEKYTPEVEPQPQEAAPEAELSEQEALWQLKLELQSPVEEIRAKADATLRALVRSQSKSFRQLPAEYTRDVIKALTMKAYTDLALTYGSEQVRGRVQSR